MIIHDDASRDEIWEAQGGRCAILRHPIQKSCGILVTSSRGSSRVIGMLGAVMEEFDFHEIRAQAEKQSWPAIPVRLPSVSGLVGGNASILVAAAYSLLLDSNTDVDIRERCLADLNSIHRWLQAPDDHKSEVGLWPLAVTDFLHTGHQAAVNIGSYVHPGGHLRADIYQEIYAPLLQGHDVSEDLFMARQEGVKRIALAWPLDPTQPPFRGVPPKEGLPTVGRMADISWTDWHEEAVRARQDLPENLQYTKECLTKEIPTGQAEELNDLTFWIHFFREHGWDDDSSERAALGAILGWWDAILGEIPIWNQPIPWRGRQIIPDNSMRDFCRSVWSSQP